VKWHGNRAADLRRDFAILADLRANGRRNATDRTPTRTTASAFGCNPGEPSKYASKPWTTDAWTRTHRLKHRDKHYWISVTSSVCDFCRLLAALSDAPSLTIASMRIYPQRWDRYQFRLCSPANSPAMTATISSLLTKGANFARSCQSELKALFIF
jgi:hypothetical protein